VALGIAWTCRIVLVTVLVLSAGWKVGHRPEFARAYRGLAPSAIAGFAAPALWIVAAVELATAALVLAGTWVGPALAIVVVGAFTIRIAATPELAECGCWTMSFVPDPAGARRLTLWRNAVVLAVAAVALVGPTDIATRDLLAPVTAGVLLGLVVVELPLIASIATIHRRLVNRA
jgi:Methylamine utilisation protein MauE